MRLKHHPQTQLIAPGKHYGTVQLWSPDMMQRLLWKALDWHGNRICHGENDKAM
jgi:hypothetical protein